MRKVTNFCELEGDHNSVCVEQTGQTVVQGPLVSIICRAGNCYFHHSMTPTQARQLATYLQATANECEKPAEVVFIDEEAFA